MSGGVLVAGVGNLFLGDDGFGPAVTRRMAGAPLPAGVRCVDYGIRGMHLAFDLLDGVDALVLVDAAPGPEPPGTVVVLEVGEGDLGRGAFDAHGMDPAAVLASLHALGGRLPRTVLVACRPADVGEGIGLTPRVEAAVDVAVGLVADVVESLLVTGPRVRSAPARGAVG